MIGNMAIRDGDVCLTRGHWLKRDETAWVRWPETGLYVSDGRVTVRNRKKPKMGSSFSILDDWNGVVLRVMLAVRQKRGHKRLSEGGRNN